MALFEVWVAIMCQPGIRVSLDKPDHEAVQFKNKRGESQMTEKVNPHAQLPTVAAKKPNPLAVPLKVPGMG